VTEKQFIESQKECASLLGLSMKEYLDYCKAIKVSKREIDNLVNNNSIITKQEEKNCRKDG